MNKEPESDPAPAEARLNGQALVARELRRYRECARLSRSELAARVGYSRTYISASEKPGAGLISKAVVTRIDEELGAHGALIALHAQADAERQARRTPTGTAWQTADSARSKDPPIDIPGNSPDVVNSGVAGLLPTIARNDSTAHPVTVADVIVMRNMLSALTESDRHTGGGRLRSFATDYLHGSVLSRRKYSEVL